MPVPNRKNLGKVDAAMNMSSISDLITRLEKRDWRALSRAISIVENNYEGKEKLQNYAYQAAKEDCLVIGITGAGGAGKSTLIDSILEIYSKEGKRVGVLAVDPSSSYTGGAVLGDRIRMGSHTMEKGIFIRSFGSRGSLGGISQGAKDALYLYKSFGFDLIIVESYGVGQAETDITNYVDVTTVVVAPGNGDYIQLAKAGTQEIADIFVINKADNPEAEALYLQMGATFSVFPENQRPVLVKTIARDHKGADELVEAFRTTGEKLRKNRNTKKRLRIIDEILSGAMCDFNPHLRKAAEAMAEQVFEGELTPYEAARKLGARLSIT